MKNLSLRLRYLTSYLVLLMPILIFSFVLYFSTLDQGTQYTNASSMQQFTYAAENISSIITRLEYSANSALSLEDQLIEKGYGGYAVRDEASVCNILRAMEERISPRVNLLFYLRGDACLYTSDGKMGYSEWEKQYTQEYNLPMSRFFYHLMTFTDQRLLPLQSAGNKTLLGLAYLARFPAGRENASAVLVYLLHDSILQEEFQNYLGDITGDLFIYDNKYKELYSVPMGETPLIPFEDMVKVRGVGLRQVEYNGEKLALLRVTDSDLGLTSVLVTPDSLFYAENLGARRLLLLLIVAMIALILILALGAVFFNYKPIHDLVEHVTGRRKPRALKKNELEIIKTYYDQSIDEAEELSTLLSELTPLVAQQFVNKLIFGKIVSREELNALSRSADIPFSRPWTTALYVLIPAQSSLAEHDDTALKRCSLLASRFRPAQCMVAYGELTTENALCVLMNFAAEEGREAEESLALARQLSDMFEDAELPRVRVGVGRAYRDPLLMPESFAEASAAVQLAPVSRERVFVYAPHGGSGQAEGSRSFSGVSGMALTLLTVGIQRGEKSVALRALQDMLSEITAVTDSFVYFRFYCAELLSAMIRQAEALGIPLEQNDCDSFIDYKSQAEFTEKATALLEYLCDAVCDRIQREDDQNKRRVMDYILENYKQFDLSIQTVSDALNIRKAQITALLKEDTGQNFVQYVSYLRMNEFKRLLLETDRAIQECVNEIGYSDVPNFLRKFKSIENCTPGQYRAMHRQRE